ncbi:serine/threonine-protein kinase [Streptomyces sp. DSM 44915]|uniref:Serine/threonine-protein kinase n=1 Tax=Streptomyces chisholmiae TaxID=3075540 RepID=A0ABU2JV10_9ACTN|nr:serine/threonine-protein kinase [Streptomyces sp. DSM 44915]MDT0268584.1 serine/threonine-protein kinase [Streptomyces sp. DSM 44915]
MRDQLFGGRYQLVRELGKGGMGEVWEARDETLGRSVAVKVISLLAGGGSHGDQARARFLREARITARLQHPNVVTIHDLGEASTEGDRVPFLVMELIRGEGLDARLRRGAVTLRDAARWGAQISDALADAHDAGITHRDIKPSNIFIAPSGIVKVLDFGIARAADPDATADPLTQTGFIVGTPSYMAPEQARGLPEPASDLYALGCLLFEMITGQLPFQAADTVGYLAAHLTQDPPTPSAVRPGIPAAWDDLVLTLLHKAPHQRYPNAAALSRALRQLVHTPESPAGAATLPATKADIPVAPEPGEYLLATSIGAEGTVRLWDPATGRPVSQPLTGHTGTVFRMAFSPDGRFLATGSMDTTVRLWETATGQLVGEPLTGHTDTVEDVAFSPDGRLLATGSLDSTVRLWDPATGQPVGDPLTGHAGHVLRVAFSPDGRLLATGSRDWTVRLWDPATGHPVGSPLVGHTNNVWANVFSSDGALLITHDEDNTVLLWDPAAGQPVGQPWTGPINGAMGVVSSPDSLSLVVSITGGEDSTVRLWDPTTRQPFGQPLHTHTSAPLYLALSPRISHRTR